MADKKVINFKEIPGALEVFGISLDPVLFTPEAVFKEYGIPQEYYYSFKLKPLSEADKSSILSLLCAMQTKALAWVNEEGVDMSYYGKDVSKLGLDKEQLKAILTGHQRFNKKISELNPRTENFNIARKYVVDLEGYFTVNADGTPEAQDFTADPSGAIAPELWATIPDKVRTAVLNELHRISNITGAEIAAL